VLGVQVGSVIVFGGSIAEIEPVPEPVLIDPWDEIVITIFGRSKAAGIAHGFGRTCAAVLSSDDAHFIYRTARNDYRRMHMLTPVAEAESFAIQILAALQARS
jgi:hypothetical protein